MRMIFMNLKAKFQEFSLKKNKKKIRGWLRSFEDCVYSFIFENNCILSALF